MKRQYRKRADKAPMCITRGCRRARYNGTLCSRHLADQLWATAVKERDKTCRVRYWLVENGCGGWLEADHLISRSYGATRYVLENGLTMCLAHHKHFTHHPLEHEDVARQQLGDERYTELRRLALSHQAEAPEDAIERLRTGVPSQT